MLFFEDEEDKRMELLVGVGQGMGTPKLSMNSSIGINKLAPGVNKQHLFGFLYPKLRIRDF